MSHEPIDGTARNGSVVLATRDYGGNGPDLLFIPGAGQTLVDCDLLAPSLTARHRVVSMDLRGHGFSGDGPFTWEAALDDVDAVAAATNLQDAAVVGHSLGGMIAVLHGARHPDALGAVNLDGHGTGSPDQYDGVAPEVVAERMAEAQRLGEAQIAELDARPPFPAVAMDIMIAQYQALYGLEEKFTRQALTRAYVADGDGFRQRVTAAQTMEVIGAVQALDLPAAYRSCRAPLLVFNAVKPGSAAPGSPPWMDEHLAAYRRGLSHELAALAADIPTMRWIEIDATHALIYEQPKRVAAEIVGFLSRSGS